MEYTEEEYKKFDEIVTDFWFCAYATMRQSAESNRKTCLLCMNKLMPLEIKGLVIKCFNDSKNLFFTNGKEIYVQIPWREFHSIKKMLKNGKQLSIKRLGARKSLNPKKFQTISSTGIVSKHDSKILKQIFNAYYKKGDNE